MALAFKKAPKINEMFKNALLKKVRDKNANEVDLSDEEEDLLAKELAEAERRKVEKKKK
jgi:hypothetical protein